MINFKSVKEILIYLEDNSPESVLCDGYNDAIVGVAETKHGEVCVYSREKAIKSLMKDGVDSEEAEEYFEYNTIRALHYMGELAPIFIVGLKNASKS